MASCVRNILAKNYRNLTIGFQATVENDGDVFFGTRCIISDTMTGTRLYCVCRSNTQLLVKEDV